MTRRAVKRACKTNMTNILVLPDEILDKVLSYRTYDEVSRLRLVCKTFNASAQRILNQGFYRSERYHSQCLKKVKEQLPRRESERRKHPLAAHCEILTAVETRLSLLSMTFKRYIDQRSCCFIPGKVLDEIFRILRFVASVSNPPTTHEVLQELRDLSSMAIEHFDEHILPKFAVSNPVVVPKLRALEYEDIRTSLRGAYHYCSSSQLQEYASQSHDQIDCQCKMNGMFCQDYQRYKEVKRDQMELKRKHAEFSRKFTDVNHKATEQGKVVAELNSRVTEQERKINELEGKFAKYDKIVNGVLNSMLEFRDNREPLKLPELMDTSSVEVLNEDITGKETNNRPSENDRVGPRKRKMRACQLKRQNKKFCEDVDSW